MTPPTNPASPPSARDFQVYEHVAIEGNTTRQAAQRFKISQTRVCQILRRVAAFAAVALPGILESEAPEAQRLAVSKNVAALRLEHLYQQSMAAWNESRGESWRICNSGGKPVRTTVKDCGKVVYLREAAKISRQAMELAMPLPMGCLAQENDEPDIDEAADAEPAERQDVQPLGSEGTAQSPDHPPTASELFTMHHEAQQMIAAVAQLRDELREYDERAAATPSNGDCSKSASRSGSAAETGVSAATQVPTSHAEAFITADRPAVTPSIDAGLFNGPRARPAEAAAC